MLCICGRAHYVLVAPVRCRYNENWIVVVGQGFSFEVTHEVKHVLWMYLCDVAILCYKAGARQVGT